MQLLMHKESSLVWLFCFVFETNISGSFLVLAGNKRLQMVIIVHVLNFDGYDETVTDFMYIGLHVSCAFYLEKFNKIDAICSKH